MTLRDSLGLRLANREPALQALGEAEVGVSEFIPYAAHFDDKTLITKNEELIQIIKVEGLPFETADDHHLRLKKIFRNNLLRAMAKSQYALYVHTVRHRRNLSARVFRAICPGLEAKTRSVRALCKRHLHFHRTAPPDDGCCRDQRIH